MTKQMEVRMCRNTDCLERLPPSPPGKSRRLYCSDACKPRRMRAGEAPNYGERHRVPYPDDQAIDMVYRGRRYDGRVA